MTCLEYQSEGLEFKSIHERETQKNFAREQYDERVMAFASNPQGSCERVGKGQRQVNKPLI